MASGIIIDVFLLEDKKVMMKLGTLKEIIDLRSVWPHEALNFTPWVAENVDLLADGSIIYSC